MTSSPPAENPRRAPALPLARMKHTALTLTALTALACGSGRPPALTPAPQPAPTPAPPAPRTYCDLGAPVAVDQRHSGKPPESFSRDATLAAFALEDPAGIALFDLDRHVFVGRPRLPTGQGHLVTLHVAPGGDLLAHVSRDWIGTAPATARYDGRTGALIGVAEGIFSGFVTVDGRAFYVVVDEAAHTVGLRALAPGVADLPALPLPVDLRGMVVAQSGVLVLGTETSARAIDAHGRELWSRSSPLGYAAEASVQAGALLEQDHGRVHIIDLATGKERRTVAGGRIHAAPIVTSDADGRFAIVDAGPAARAPLVLGPRPRAFGVAPGARFAAWVAPDGTVSVADVAGGTIRRIGDVSALPVNKVILSGDGELCGAVAPPTGPTALEWRDGHARFTPPTAPTTRVWRDGRELFTVRATCSFVFDATGAARVVTCTDGRWFDMSGAAPRPMARAGVPLASDVAFDDGAVPAFTALCETTQASLGEAGARGKALSKRPTVERAWQPAGASALAFDEEGVDVWNVAAARLRGRIASPSWSDRIAALSADAGSLALERTGSLAIDLFRVADGALARTIDLPAQVTTLAFRGDKELLVATALEEQGCCWSERKEPRERYPAGGKVTTYDATTGRALRSFAGERFVVDAAGSALGVTMLGRAAVVDAATGKTIATFAGRERMAALSTSGRFAVLEAVEENTGVVTTRIVDVPGGTERVVLRGKSAGIAFDRAGTRVVLAPVTGMIRAPSLVLYDGARLVREDIPLPEPGARPFFAHGDAVLGYETEGGVGFLRLADRRELAVRGFERGGKCHLYATTPDGTFAGDAEGGLGIRLGDDLAASELLLSGPRFEAHRRADLVARFFDGK